jgi:hypothetical protein
MAFRRSRVRSASAPPIKSRTISLSDNIGQAHCPKTVRICQEIYLARNPPHCSISRPRGFRMPLLTIAREPEEEIGLREPSCRMLSRLGLW